MAAKKGITFAGFVSPFIAMAPELIETADNHTNGAVTNGINNGINTVMDPVRDLANGAVNKANGIVNQFIDAYASLNGSAGVSNNNYGQ